MPRLILEKANRTVRPFVLADVNEAPWLPCEAPEVLARICQRSGIWTGWRDHEVVAICGVTPLNEFVAEAWTYLMPGIAARETLWLFRATKRILHNYVAAMGFWRVQALCDEAQPGARNWLEHLGTTTAVFHVESEMPLAGPHGETLLRYVWFPKGMGG